MSNLSQTILEQLVRLPSVNPRLVAGETDAKAQGESRVTEYLVNFCHERSWPYFRQLVHEQTGTCGPRENLVAMVPATTGASQPTLLLEAHQDTVSVEGMAIDPFAAEVREGRLWGRGACDVKGGMAALLAALTRYSQQPERPHSVLAAFTVNEECGFSGIRALAKLWDQPSDEEATLPEAVSFTPEALTEQHVSRLRPAAAIVAEPTELDVVVAHRGVVRWQAQCHGRAAHSSDPSQGDNALYAMAEVTRAIRQCAEQELVKRPADPRCGLPTASVNTFHGGVGANTVPDLATIDIDRRLSPGELPEDAYQELIAWIAQRADLGECRIEHLPPWMESHGLAEGTNLALAERVSAVAQQLVGRGKLTGVGYGANAATLAAVDIPSVVFGPGSIAQAHTVDEWIDLEELRLAEQVYYELASGSCDGAVSRES